MRKYVTSLLAAAGIAATSSALPAFGQEKPSPGAPEPEAESCTPLKRLFAHKRWREAHPLDGENPCQSPNAAKLKEEFFTYRAYRRLAHVRGFKEGDPYLEWLPRIPKSVIACETRGHYGESRWHASNHLGASGPAQLMPMWNPPVIRDNQDKLEYWRIVHGLWGHTSWDCA